MSETPETPNPEASSTTETPVTPPAAPPPPASTAAAASKRGIWKYLGAGAAGLVLGLLIAGGVAWGLSDSDGHKQSRPASHQQQNQYDRQMPSGRGGPGGQMPGGSGQQGQNGPQTQQNGSGGGTQAQPYGSQGGMGAGGRTRAS